MTTIQIEAKDVQVGDLIHNSNYGRNEVTRIGRGAGTSVTVLLDHMAPHTFRNVHELITVDREV